MSIKNLIEDNYIKFLKKHIDNSRISDYIVFY
jgi:hypothetical protein